jgi:hypothetical protein
VLQCNQFPVDRQYLEVSACPTLVVARGTLRTIMATPSLPCSLVERSSQGSAVDARHADGIFQKVGGDFARTKIFRAHLHERRSGPKTTSTKTFDVDRGPDRNRPRSSTGCRGRRGLGRRSPALSGLGWSDPSGGSHRAPQSGMPTEAPSLHLCRLPTTCPRSGTFKALTLVVGVAFVVVAPDGEHPDRQRDQKQHYAEV